MVTELPEGNCSIATQPFKADRTRPRNRRSRHQKLKKATNSTTLLRMFGCLWGMIRAATNTRITTVLSRPHVPPGKISLDEAPLLQPLLPQGGGAILLHQDSFSLSAPTIEECLSPMALIPVRAQQGRRRKDRTRLPPTDRRSAVLQQEVRQCLQLYQPIQPALFASTNTINAGHVDVL